MARIHAHRGLRPADHLAAQVISPPYDVLSEQEARDLCEHNDISFLHVTRPEVNFPPGIDCHSQQAYREARNQLDRLHAQGALVADTQPCVYLYGQAMPMKDEQGRCTRVHEQVGLLTCVSVQEYDQGLIKKHEHTRPVKVEDRTAHMEMLDAQVGLVFLAYRDHAAATAVIERYTAAEPAWSVTTEDDVAHTLWVVSDSAAVREIQQAFAQLPALYVADGHHRSQSASLLASRRPGDGEHRWFLAGIYPASALQVLAYNRQVADLNGHSVQGFLEQVQARFELTAGVAPIPDRRGRITMYLDGCWYGLLPRPELVPDDPVGGLDVSVLQDQLLGPLLGIGDPRTDERIHFVGGIRGPSALQRAVDSGAAAVAFHMFPTAMEQLFDVADTGQVMPPKSTWFEPKLRGGVVLHKLS